ncbi:MAG: tyrosine-protein phosphatase [Clostridia bacterium]|nr:tyrosine-protein phosphatase [Clostridia bacterium]
MIPIQLDTVRNIRDLGGTVAEGGRRIRPDCLIRSAHLAEASEADLLRLRREHRLCTVIDLRTDQERAEKPDRAEGLELITCTLIERLAGITHERRDEPARLPDMAELYRQMMTNPVGVAGFRRALRDIFSHDYGRGSVLWHCTEGKDRCGMTAALVLEALGVDREAILEDYLETNKASLTRAQAIYDRLAPEHGEVFARSVYQAFIADERYIRAAWEAMGEDYIGGTLGIAPDEVEAFREKVLV